MSPIASALLHASLWIGAPEADQGCGARASASLEPGLGLHDEGGRVCLRVGLFGQLRYTAAAASAGISHGLEVRVARPVLAAHLWRERVKAWVMPELAGDAPQLLDAAALVRVHEAFAVQLGQYRPWLSRGYRTGLPVQALPDRGPVVGEFRVDRDVGLTLRGRPWGGRFEYYLGVMSGAAPRAGGGEPGLLYTSRLVVAPLGPVGYDQVPHVTGHDELRVALGASAYTFMRDEGSPGDPTDGAPRDLRAARRELGASVDLVLFTGRVSALAEGFWRRRLGPHNPAEDAWGGYGQLAAALVPERVELATRVGVHNTGPAASPLVPFEPGLNLYFARHHAKLQARYTCVLATLGGDCEHHEVTAQVQLQF